MHLARNELVRRVANLVAPPACPRLHIFRGASQPATDAAPRVEHAQERRQALDGEWYTMEQFRQCYQEPYGSFSAWRRYWDRAVREAVPPGAASTRGVSSSDARAPGGKLMKVPWPPKGPPPEADAQYFVKATSSGREESDSPPGASQPGLSEGTSASTPRTESAGPGKPEILIQPNCMRCDWLGSGVELDSEWRVVGREPVCRACNAIAPSSRTYVYDQLS